MTVKQFYTTNDLIAVLGLSKRAIYDDIEAGILAASKLNPDKPKSPWVIEISAGDAYIASKERLAPNANRWELEAFRRRIANRLVETTGAPKNVVNGWVSRTWVVLVDMTLQEICEKWGS